MVLPHLGHCQILHWDMKLIAGHVQKQLSEGIPWESKSKRLKAILGRSESVMDTVWSFLVDSAGSCFMGQSSTSGIENVSALMYLLNLK